MSTKKQIFSNYLDHAKNKESKQNFDTALSLIYENHEKRQKKLLKSMTIILKVFLTKDFV